MFWKDRLIVSTSAVESTLHVQVMVEINSKKWEIIVIVSPVHRV